MAILACQMFSSFLFYDGISTSVDYDFTDLIKNNDALHNKVLVGVESLAISPAVLSTTVNGNVVTFTWATPPAVNRTSFNIFLTFNAA